MKLPPMPKSHADMWNHFLTRTQTYTTSGNCTQQLCARQDLCASPVEDRVRKTAGAMFVGVRILSNAGLL